MTLHRMSEAEAWTALAEDLDATPLGHAFDTSQEARGFPEALWWKMSYRSLEFHDPPIKSRRQEPFRFWSPGARDEAVLFMLLLAAEAEDEGGAA